MGGTTPHRADGLQYIERFSEPSSMLKRKGSNFESFLEPLNLAARDPHLLPPGVNANRQSGVPLYRQIYDGLRSAILDGRLDPGTRLPSTRAAALELGVARNTVIAVFEQLVAEGFLRSGVGDGTWVADFEPELLSRPVRKGPKPPASVARAYPQARFLRSRCGGRRSSV